MEGVTNHDGHVGKTDNECERFALIFFWITQNPVGASLLAMDVNEDAYFLNERGALESIASKLAPTGGWGVIGV